MSRSEWEKVIATGVLTCRICGVQRPLTEFQQLSSNRRLKLKDCTYCLRARKAIAQRKRRLVRFGMTLESFRQMLDVQVGRCAICSGLLGSSGITVDHDHGSGAVRGLVHRNCNLTIGYAHEDLAVLIGAVDYLVRHHPRKVWCLAKQVFVPLTKEA